MEIVIFDLDDTLHKEIEYLKAAYKLIAQKIWGDDWCPHYQQMLIDYNNGANVFEKICLQKPDVRVQDLLDIYRYDVHELVLDSEVEDTLSNLKSRGIILGLLTDGRERTQMNKVKALGLEKWIDKDFVIVNSDESHFKPNPWGFEKMAETVVNKTVGTDFSYTYVGDNLKKDFICPNHLGWNTICIKDDGRNIHKQDFGNNDIKASPHIIIDSIKELVNVFS